MPMGWSLGVDYECCGGPAISRSMGRVRRFHPAGTTCEVPKHYYALQSARLYRSDPQCTGGVDIRVATLVRGRKVGTLAEPQQ